MNKYILLTFALMGLGFYELSGGDEFVPRKAELMAAAKAEQEALQAEQHASQAAESTSEPEIVTDVVLAALNEPAIDPLPVASETPPAVVETETTPTTLISLEQSGAMFARPLTQLGATPQQARPVLLTEPRRPMDFREVAGTRVNMRSGPGTEYSVLTSLVQGTPVEILDADGSGWVKLRVIEEETVGWMAERLLTEPTG